MLRTLSDAFTLGVISNGFTAIQNIKLDQLGWRKYFSRVVLSKGGYRSNEVASRNLYRGRSVACVRTPGNRLRRRQRSRTTSRRRNDAAGSRCGSIPRGTPRRAAMRIPAANVIVRSLNELPGVCLWTRSRNNQRWNFLSTIGGSSRRSFSGLCA